MKFVALMSGGKDSIYAAMECAALGHDLVCVANLAPPPPIAPQGATASDVKAESKDTTAEEVLESDSFMYQTVGHDVVPALATCLGVPLVVGFVRGTPLHQGLAYMPTIGDEVEDLLVLLADVVRRYPEVEAVCCGAVLSTYQRLRVECVCNRLGLKSLAPLWQRPQGELVDEMIASGVDCVLCKVASIGLDPYRHLNAPLAQLRPLLATLHAKYGVHECGEGGEYESLCLDAPIFRYAKIVIDDWSPVLHGDSGDVGLLRVHKWHTEPKFGVAAAEGSGEATNSSCNSSSGGSGNAWELSKAMSPVSPRHPAEVLAVNEEAARAFLASRVAKTTSTPTAAPVAALKPSTTPDVVVSMGPTYAANDFVFASGALVSHAVDALPSAVAAPLPAAAAPLNKNGPRLDAWTARWAVNRTHWHVGAVVHPCLAKFEAQLLPQFPPPQAPSSLPLLTSCHHQPNCPEAPPRVLVPLAGKAHDVAYFAARGCDVVAVECAPQALEQFVAAYPGATAETGSCMADPITPEATLFQRSNVILPPRLLNSEEHDLELKDKEATELALQLPQQTPRPVLWLQGDFLTLKDVPSAAAAPPSSSSSSSSSTRSEAAESASAVASAPDRSGESSVHSSSGCGGDNSSSQEDLFDAAFDRGGLVAVAPADRPAYALTLAKLLKPGVGRVLLVCAEHPPFAGGSLGPPHSVDKSEVERLFGGAFTIELLQVEDRMEQEPSWRDRGCTWFREATYLLTRTRATTTTTTIQDNAAMQLAAEDLSASNTAARVAAAAGTAEAANTAAAAAAQCDILLKELNRKLLAAGCTGGLNDAAFVHLYLRDMTHFAAVNEEYCRHFKTLQPASRSCVAALLPSGVHLLVDCTALCRSAASAATASMPASHAAGAGSALSQRRDVLHVQSLSRWAPLCIGPYCQANRLLRGSLLFLAGQIGLVPETMQLAEATADASVDETLAATVGPEARAGSSGSSEGDSVGTQSSKETTAANSSTDGAAVISPTAMAQLDQATWNTGQLLASLQSAWGKGPSSSLVSSSRKAGAAGNIKTGGSSRSGALCGVLYVTAGADPAAATTQPRRLLGALRARCLHNCRRVDNRSHGSSSSSDGEASTPLAWPPKPSRSKNGAAGPAHSDINDLSTFPLLVVGVPGLPKGAAVELEVAALSSSAVKALQPQHLQEQFTWRGEGNRTMPSPPLAGDDANLSSSSVPWLPIDLPRPRRGASTLVPPTPLASGSADEAGSGQASDAIKAACPPLQVMFDVTAVPRVLAFGFVHVHSSGNSRNLAPGAPGIDIAAQCSLHGASSALIAGIAAAFCGRSSSSSMDDVSTCARLGWRNLGHLRVFYVPSVLTASISNSTDKTSNFLGPAEVAAAVASQLAAVGASKTAVTAVPVSALPNLADNGFCHEFAADGSAINGSSECALVGQITALDPLQFETAQWVAKLDADTSSPSPSPVVPSTSLDEGQDEMTQGAEVPIVEMTNESDEALIARAAAAMKTTTPEVPQKHVPTSPTPPALPVQPATVAMDDDAFDEIFGVDFKAMREGSEVNSESDED